MSSVADTSSSVSGLAAKVNIDHADGATDFLVINGLPGNDTIGNDAALSAAAIKLTADGGDGNDIILGGQGGDLLLGGDGNDFIEGDKGNDLALMGAGNDVFQWDPGDGSDTVEGQAGTDTMLFYGSDASENSTSSPTAGVPRSSATSATSRWTSTMSRALTSGPWAAPTTSSRAT